MRPIICDSLDLLAHQQAITVLFACESGSRAWGFPSTDSDYDVRFLYSHRQDWYLSIDTKKDTLTVPIHDQLDLGGWEMRKALQLFHQSNPVLFEWIQSPIVYAQHGNFVETLRMWMPTYANLRKIMFHHLGLIRRMWADIGSEPTVKLKKYFYILRSLFSAMWVREHHRVPPMEFTPLRALAANNDCLNELLDYWLQIKAEGNEATHIPRDSRVDAYIQSQSEVCNLYASQLPVSNADVEPLNRLFREILSTDV